MTNTTSKKTTWGKKFALAGLIVVVVLLGVYWYAATKKFPDTNDRQAAFTVDAMDFIREFQADDSAANKKYREQIVTVSGRISELESPDTSTVNIKFIDTSGAYVIFAFQEQHLHEAKGLKKGDLVSVKGSCSGVAYSTILEVPYITFIRSALNK